MYYNYTFSDYEKKKNLENLEKFMRLKKGVILDTETTGLPFRDETVSITNISIISNRGEVLADFLVKPPVPIPEEVQRLNGITDEMVKDAKTWSEIDSIIHDVLKDCVIGAWNASFDRLMVEREMGRLDNKRDYCWFDLMRPYSIATGHGAKYKLEKAALDEGITDTQTHLSLGDCRMTLEVLRRFLNRNRKTAEQDLDKLAEEAGF